MDKTCHALMSEIYFTRASMWLMFMPIAHAVDDYPINKVSAVLCGVCSIAYFFFFYIENRRAK